jgi:ABC-type dipeptide/oligopeptide/nickel transport system permease component
MAYFLRKIAFFLLTLWAAATLNFIIPRIQGGDPAEAIVQRITGSNQAVDPRQVEAIRLMLGVPDEPLLQQYVDYLGAILRGEFGISYSYMPYTVTHMIGEALPWTLFLVGTTQIISFVVGTLLGTWAAWRRNSNFDTVLTASASFFGTLPFYWIAMMLLYVFAFQLHWFPDGGGFSGDVNPGWNWAFIRSALYHSMLPAICLLITGPIGWIMGMRNTMVQVLGEDYTRLARAKGLKDRHIALMYGARNAILPNVTAFAISLGALVSGSIFVEQIFDYPGMGQLMFDALGNRDYPLMQAIFLFITIGVLTANFLADMFYGFIDPRVRRGGEH